MSEMGMYIVSQRTAQKLGFSCSTVKNLPKSKGLEKISALGN